MGKAASRPSEEALGAPLPQPSHVGADTSGSLPLQSGLEWASPPAAAHSKAGANEEPWPTVDDLPYVFLETGEDYPSTDGRPMSDTDYHAPIIHYGKHALPHHYHGKREVYVGGDLLIYLDADNRRLRLAPDLFAAFGSPPGKREVYKVWEEPGGMPQFVLEVASPGTVRYDRTKKKDLYASLGVQECWLFDPRAKYLDPPLQGFRLVEGAYIPLSLGTPVQGAYSVRSEVLGLDLCPMGEELRFHDPATDNWLPSYNEDRDKRLAAEARIAELEAELRSLRP